MFFVAIAAMGILKFQSSIAPKNDRNVIPRGDRVNLILFQSSIAPKNDRNGL